MDLSLEQLSNRPVDFGELKTVRDLKRQLEHDRKQHKLDKHVVNINAPLNHDRHLATYGMNPNNKQQMRILSNFCTLPRNDRKMAPVYHNNTEEDLKQGGTGEKPDKTSDKLLQSKAKDLQISHFKVDFDVRNYNPKNLCITCDDNLLIIQASTETYNGQGRITKKQFTRKVTVPANVNKERLISKVSAEGRLIIEVPTPPSYQEAYRISKMVGCLGYNSSATLPHSFRSARDYKHIDEETMLLPLKGSKKRLTSLSDSAESELDIASTSSDDLYNVDSWFTGVN